jgi:hypothetical protein
VAADLGEGVRAVVGRQHPVLAPGVEARTPMGEALPGLSALVSAVAGRPVGPGRLLRDIGEDVARALDIPDGVSA